MTEFVGVESTGVEFDVESVVQFVHGHTDTGGLGRPLNASFVGCRTADHDVRKGDGSIVGTDLVAVRVEKEPDW